MPEDFKCEACSNSFANPIALQQHKMDRHGVGEARQPPKKTEGPSSHELRAQRREQVEAVRTTEATTVKGAKRKRSLAMYGGAIVGILIVAAYFSLVPSEAPTNNSILEGLELPGFNDHWHANYEIEICGEEMPDLPASDGGVHSHGDGQVHIHPHEGNEVGENANLGLFFDSTSVEFGSDMIGLPGDKVWTNGDACPDGRSGQLRVLVNRKQLDATDHRIYVPQDGDRVRIVFGPLEN